MVDFMFLEGPVIDEASWDKVMRSELALPILERSLAAYDRVDWTSEALKGVLDQIGQTLGVKLGKAQAPVRVAVTGRTIGPPLFESLELLGRDETLRRLKLAQERADG
jgi:glutamyl-tRNA synthetase